MKTFLKTILILLPLLTIAIINWQCNDTPLQNIYNDNESIFDGVSESFTFNVIEHVRIDPFDGESYEQDIYPAVGTWGNFQYDGPPAYFDDGFSTRQSPRVEGSNTITTLYYKVNNGARWICARRDLEAFWWIKNGELGQYFYDHYYMDGWGSTCTPPKDHSNVYSNGPTNVELPANTFIYVRYGVSIYGDRFKK